jgi:predicted DNA-binding protein with PD1-like motif
MEWREMGDAYCVRLLRDEEVLEQLTDFVTEREITAASILGIGAVKDIELGFYELETRTYHRKELAGDHELVNLTGNLSFVDGKPFVHAHVTVGGPDFRASCGHLFRAVIAVTGEFVVRPMPGQIDRAFDDACGLNLWSMPATT